MASATSKKTELKLTNVACASLEELRLDYEDFLRHRRYTTWDRGDPRRQELINARCRTADDVAKWIMHALLARGINRPTQHELAEAAANAALVLIAVACSLLQRQIEHLAQTFEDQGGFTERLYRIRAERRRENRPK